MLYSALEPIAGNWYVNRTGKLIKVRLLVYQHDQLYSVLLEYLDGQHKLISAADWFCLELQRDLRSAADSLASR